MNERTLLFVIHIICVGIVAFTQLLLPNFTRKNLVLGVAIPEEALEDFKLKRLVREFRLVTILVTLVSIILSFGMAYLWNSSVRLLILWMVFGSFILFLPVIYYNRKIREWKAASGYQIQVKKRVADLSLSKQKLTYSGVNLWLYLIPLAIVAIGSIYILINYDKIPDQIPMHYGASGEVDRYSQKSLFVALYPTLVNLFLIGVIFVSNLFFLKAKQRVAITDSEDSLRRLLIARKIWTYSFVATTTLTVLMMQGLSLTMVYNITNINPYMNWFWVIIVLIVVVQILVGLKVGNTGEKLPRQHGETLELFEDDDKYWIFGGSIYYNPDDPAVMVPKRVGLGSTINLGTTVGKIVMLGLLLIIILSIVPLFFIPM